MMNILNSTPMVPDGWVWTAEAAKDIPGSEVTGLNWLKLRASPHWSFPTL